MSVCEPDYVRVPSQGPYGGGAVRCYTGNDPMRHAYCAHASDVESGSTVAWVQQCPEVGAGDSEWMASDMAADFGHSRRGRTLQGANRASSLFVLVAVGSVVAPENTVMISASVSARARSHQGLLYISSDDPFS